MDASFEGGGALDTGADGALYALVLAGEKDVKLPAVLALADRETGGLLSAAWTRKEFTGKKGEVSLFPLPGGARRIVVVGLGKAESFSLEAVRRAGGYLAKQLKGKGIVHLAVELPSFTRGKLDGAEAAAALLDGLTLGAYEFRRYKADKPAEGISQVIFARGKGAKAAPASFRALVDRERKVLDAVLWARDIGNLPADVATPEFMAQQALELAKGRPLKVTVLDEARLRELGCGGILAVGQGSHHPPRMVLMEYAGKPATRGGRPKATVAIVGKGITFDSGGISLKPALNMGEMKFDKSGAVAVLGTMRAVADLGLPVRVIGVMGFAENLPGGGSYRPGDVVRAFNGKTIEVLNTDAEGRVVLSDALSYVTKTYSPDEVVDLATLTGACVVALGVDTAGLMSTSDALSTRLLSASAATGERLWRMPITETHHEMVKSDIADVKNSVEIPVAGALTAAAFLSQFVGDTPWAHLDIAGTAYVGKTGGSFAAPYTPPGYGAFGIRLLCQYLSRRA